MLDKIKKHKLIEDGKGEINFYNWYVDSLILERKKYFLFTNSKNLFSFFFYCDSEKEIKKNQELFENKLAEQILREVGTNGKCFENLFPKNSKPRYLKTNSRSILESMNDFKFQIKFLSNYHGKLKKSYNLTNHLINEIPMKSLNYDQSVKAMRMELESRIK